MMAILGSIPFSDYRKLSGVSFSALKCMGVSPLEFKFRLDHPTEPTDAMSLGIVEHAAVFEPERLPLMVSVWEGSRRAGNVWETFRELCGGKTILRIDDYRRVLGMRDAVHNHSVANKYVTGGAAEVAFTWTDPHTGLPCKGRADYLIGDGEVLCDLKTASRIDPLPFGTQAARLSYHGQMAFYADGICELTGKFPKVILIALQSEEPYDVVCYQLSPEALDAGEQMCMRWLETLKKCQECDQWPGQGTQEQVLALPRWAYGQDEDDEIVLDGETVKV